MGDESEQGLPQDLRAGRGIALLADARTSRARQVGECLRACGLRLVHWHADEVSRTSPILVVSACGLEGTERAESLRRMREMSACGLTVLAYEDGASAWPLGVRCEVLLAGARDLLDSSVVEFTERLRTAAETIVAAETARRSECDRLKALFRKLEIVGESPAMLQLFRSTVRLSRLSDVTTLLLGETGTGKELFARAIHRLDPKRGQGPFVAVNCSALPATLAESELFGYRAGAFTGAVRDRKGFFRAAHGGVIFLDEVGDLAPELQGKLLRVLQEGRVLGLGEDLETDVDVRVIAATNRDLEAAVRKRRFRADLYHRLNVVALRVPPLRERREDLAPLVDHFLRKYRNLSSTALEGVRPEVGDVLARLELPGNAREIENIIRQALLCKEDSAPLDLRDLPPRVWQAVARQSASPPTEAAPRAKHPASPLPWSDSPGEVRLEPGRASLANSLRQCERMLLERALQMTHGNQTQTAQLLGITPRSVYSKLRRHGLIP